MATPERHYSPAEVARLAGVSPKAAPQLPLDPAAFAFVGQILSGL